MLQPIRLNIAMDISKIAVVVYDNLPDHCNSLKQNLIDLTHWKVSFGGGYNFHIEQTQNVTATLTQLANNHKWAVVVAAGHWLGYQKHMIKNIEYAVSQHSPLSCHILDDGEFFHFHPQWFVLDLEVYRQLGFPALEPIDQPLTFEVKQIERCEENAHDDYTPWWIKSSDNKQQYSVSQQRFGMNLLRALMDCDFYVVNIPTEIRQNKCHSYPEYNQVELEKIAANMNYCPVMGVHKYDDVLEYFTKLFQIRYDLRKVYVLNTEPVIPLSNTVVQFDCFIGPASGIKSIVIAGQECFDDNTTVVLFDQRGQSLVWQQFLLHNWDGDLNQLKQMISKIGMENFFQQELTDQWFTEEIDWFLLSAGIDRNEFQRRWQRYKKMNHQFVSLNLSNVDQLSTLVQNNSTVGAYVWLSNIFQMEYEIFSQTQAKCKDNIDRFVAELGQSVASPLAVETCSRGIDFINF